MTREAKLYNGEKRVSSINGAWQTGQLHIKTKLKYPLTPYKMDSWPNLRLDTIKLLCLSPFADHLNYHNIVNQWYFNTKQSLKKLNRTTMRYHLMLFWKTIIKKSTNINAGYNVAKKGTLL